MEKTEFFRIVNEILAKASLKKKGFSWSNDNGTLLKIVKLQKSNFGNHYYLNFGIIFKGLDFSGVDMHIYRRLSWANDVEKNEINDLLNLDSNIPSTQRKERLSFYIEKEILAYFENLNNENDVVKTLGTVVPSNTISMIVKAYLKLK